MLAQSLALCGIIFFILLSMAVIFVLDIFKCSMRNVSMFAMIHMVCLIRTSRVITLSTSKDDSVTVKKTIEGTQLSESRNRLMVQN